MSDMTLTEAQAAMRQFEKDGDGAFNCTVILSTRMGPLFWAIYPAAMPTKSLTGHAETWREAVEAMRQAWTNFQDQHSASMIRKMALKIITITADTGSCSAAALRMGNEFTDQQITQHGPAACEEANKLASNGPFSITPTASNQVAA